MDLKSGKGRKWRKSGSAYEYITSYNEIVLGKILYIKETNSYKVEKIDSHGEYVLIGGNFRDPLAAAKLLVDTIG